MQNAVIYARYSSHNQRDVSIDQQVAACQRYADELGARVIRVYDDRAMTGTNDKRPAFQRMLHDSAAGGFQLVIVYSLDRFSRDRYDSAVHKHTLKVNGVRVVSAMERITDDPTGVLMESVLEGFAEYYSKELAQKIRRGIRDNALKGKVIGSIPYGYRRGADGSWQLDADRAAIVREIFHRYLSGETLTDIARRLNERGVRTARGKPWTRSSFASLLACEKYIGVLVYDDLRIEDAVPPIISRDDWLRVQRMTAGGRHPVQSPARRRTSGGVFLLTGKLYCGLCGAPMVGTSGTSRNGQRMYYYFCTKHRAGCAKKAVRRETAERLVAEQLQRTVLRDDLIEWMADEAVRAYESAPQRAEVGILEAELKEVSTRKQNALQAILDGIATRSVRDALTALEAREDELRARIAEARAAMPIPVDREHLTAFLRMFRDGDVSDPAFQEALFDAFLVKAFLFDDRAHIYFSANGRSEEVEAAIAADVTEDDSGGWACSDKRDSTPLTSPYPNTIRSIGHAVFEIRCRLPA